MWRGRWTGALWTISWACASVLLIAVRYTQPRSVHFPLSFMHCPLLVLSYVCACREPAQVHDRRWRFFPSRLIVRMQRDNLGLLPQSALHSFCHLQSRAKPLFGHTLPAARPRVEP